MTNNIVYKDDSLTITEKGELLQCDWISNSPINHSYMEAKLSEYIGNKFPGSWPVNNEGEVLRGMRLFILEWKEDILTSRWL